MKVVVLASGRGSNLAALLEARSNDALPIEIAAVLSDRANARALAIADAAGIPNSAFDRACFDSRRAFDQALFDRIGELAPELIVLAGYMRILDADVLAPWIGRLLNIHPSLLPKYPGLRTHQRALDAGDVEHGASVHFVTAELDGGPVVSQATIAIRPDDDASTLARRLLPREHDLLVATVDLFARGRLGWRRGLPILDGQPIDTPLKLAGSHGRRFERIE